MLTNIGYNNIETVENGKQAIDAIEVNIEIKEPYDILLLDLRMPIKNGYDVIRYHKDRNWNLPHIIITTACVLEEDKEKCKNMGVNFFINKPIELKQLKETMLYVSNLI